MPQRYAGRADVRTSKKRHEEQLAALRAAHENDLRLAGATLDRLSLEELEHRDRAYQDRVTYGERLSAVDMAYWQALVAEWMRRKFGV